MQATIDRVGRVVIPKQIRDARGLWPDTELEITIDGGGVRLEPVRQRERPVEESDGSPLLGRVEHAHLTDADVRRLRDDLRR
jgi:AbrB family looped-hinge helix DNA binding protein